MPLLFMQNSKNVGSMGRYRDDDYGIGAKRIDDSAPNYTPAINAINQNTF